MIRKSVGTRIREIRNKKQLSQEACALETGINQTYWSDVECGKRNISIVNLNKICIFFGISLKDFFNSSLFEN